MGDLVLQWVQQQIAFNTSANDYTFGKPSVAVDASGNVYVAYWTEGGTVSGGTNNNGTYDIVVFKLGTDGSLLWTQQQTSFNTSSNDFNPSITVDASGNVYVAYQTNSGTVSGGTNNNGPSGPTGDIVVFKLGTDGSLLWTQQKTAFNTSSNDFNPSITVDASGNVYVAYWTNGGTVSGGTNNNGSSGPIDDIVVFKLGTDGTLQWTQQQTAFNTSSNDVYPSITVDDLGNVYVAYWTNGGTVSGGTNNNGSSGPIDDIVVFKLGTDGTLQWTQQQTAFNTSSNDFSPSITVDASGNVYVAYYTFGTVSGGSIIGTADIVVFKLGTDGTLLWTQQQTAFNTSSYDVFPSITVDASGNVYVAYFTLGGTVSGGTNNNGTYDIVVFKLSGTDGTLQWTQQQTAFNTSSYDSYPSITVDASGNVYVAYFTFGTVSGGTNNNGTYDIVVFKLGLIPSVICVFPGALVFTTNGLKKIEDLRAGDMLYDESDQQVELINNIRCHPSSKGYTTFSQNCFGLNFPSDNLIITDGHPIKFPNSRKEFPVERLTNGQTIVRKEGQIPETYSLVTRERIFIPINNIPVCTWSESKFHKYARNEKLEYTLL